MSRTCRSSLLPQMDSDWCIHFTGGWWSLVVAAPVGVVSEYRLRRGEARHFPGCDWLAIMCLGVAAVVPSISAQHNSPQDTLLMQAQAWPS